MITIFIDRAPFLMNIKKGLKIKNHHGQPSLVKASVVNRKTVNRKGFFLLFNKNILDLSQILSLKDRETT